jgi:hypothetical protein
MGEIDFALTEQDVVAATKLHYRAQIARHWKLKLILFGLVVLLGSTIAMAGDARLFFDSWVVQLLLTMLVLLVGIMIIMYFAVLPILARRHSRQTKTFQAPIRAFWTHESITYSADWGSTKIAWADYHKWTMDPRYLMLFQSDVAFNILPRKLLGEARAEAIMSMLTDAKVKRV